MTTYDVREILRQRLRKLGCDGLAGEECGCGIDDLAPCGGCCLGCRPARSEVTQQGIVWRPALVVRPGPVRVNLPRRYDSEEGEFAGETRPWANDSGYFLIYDEVVAALKAQGVEADQ